MFDAKVLLKRLPSFSVSKNYGNPTRETNFKVAVNVANPNSLMKKTLVPLNCILTNTLRQLLFSISMKHSTFEFAYKSVLSLYLVTFLIYRQTPQEFRSNFVYIFFQVIIW